MSSLDLDQGDAAIASPSAAFRAHLARFQAPSPSSSPRLPSRSTPPVAPSPPPARTTRLRTPRQKSATATPPRRDGTSPHFGLDHLPSPSPTKKPKLGDDDDMEESPGKEAKKKKKKKGARPYADPSIYAELNGLTDYIKVGTKLILCGINPGLMSARKGEHYASPTNHFWPSLAGSGLTDRRLAPSEGPTLAEEYDIGLTNLVPRPTAEMSELSEEEKKACVPSFLAKIVHYRPRMVAFVGMGICQVVFRYLHELDQSPLPSSDGTESPTKKRGRRKAMPPISVGLQPVTISLPPLTTKEEGKEREGKEDEHDRKVLFWCLPSTSARVVKYQLVDKIKIFAELKADVDKLVLDGSLDLPSTTIDYPSERLFPSTAPSIVTSGYFKEEVSQFDDEQESSKIGTAAAAGTGWNVTMIEEIKVEGDEEGIREPKEEGM